MGESSDTRELCRVLELKPFNAMTYPLVGSEYQPGGWPDRYLCWGANEYLGLAGWRGFIEFKGATGKLSDSQISVIMRLRERGENVLVCRVVGNAWEFIDLEGKELCQGHKKTLFMQASERLSLR